MKEKIVENWLISASERSYQGPLCSLLGTKGYKVIHSTRHCAMEMGKDIIAESPEGELVCLQLKALKGKRLKLSDWRSDLQQQVLPLVMGTVVHPAADSQKIHKSIIVVTGYIDEEVSHEITQFNQGQVNSGHPNNQIEVWTLGDLISMFSEYLNKFGPDQPEDFKRWLELFLDGGNGLPDKENFFIFTESLLAHAKLENQNEINEFVAFLFVLGGSIANQYSEKNNYIAEIEIWLATWMQVLYVQNKHNTPDKQKEVSQAILTDIVLDLLTKLESEASERVRASEFDEVFEDMEQIFAPQTAALLAIFLYLQKITDKLTAETQSKILQIIETLLAKSKLACEASICYSIIVDLILIKFDKKDIARQSLIDIVMALIKVNLKNTQNPLPSPYYDIETVVLNMLGEDLDSSISDDTFEKSSFTLRSLIYLLVNLEQRPFLESVWKEITYFHCQEYKAEDPLSLLKRRSKNGINYTIKFDTPQSWVKLQAQEKKFTEGESLPECLKDDPLNLLFLLYSQPYRLNPEYACFLNGRL